MTFHGYMNTFNVNNVIVHCDGAYTKVDKNSVIENRIIRFFNGLHIKPKFLIIDYVKRLRDINCIDTVHVYCKKACD